MANHQKNSSQAVQLKKFPFLSPQLKRRVLVGVRPYRKGGIRLQLQKIQNKNIIYNYGHGGAGISLAPCCAIEVADLAVQAGKNKKVAVIGSGIIGLMSALECVNRGFQVTIYAERIPQPNEKNVLDMCTSQVAPGYWLPFHYQFSDLQQHKRRTQISYNKYLEWLKKSAHIYQVQCFQQMQPQLFKQSSPQFMYQKSKNIKVKIGNKQLDVIYFKTLQLNLQKFLQDVIKECKSKGIKFQNLKVNGMNDILKLREDTIIACLGLNSKKVFKDENVYGVKGHLIELQTTSRWPTFLRFQFQGQLDLYCFEDKLLIGFSRQYSEDMKINEQTARLIENRAYNFIKYVGLDVKPKL